MIRARLPSRYVVMLTTFVVCIYVYGSPLNSSFVSTDSPELLHLLILAKEAPLWDIVPVAVSSWRMTVMAESSFLALLGWLLETLVIMFADGSVGVLSLFRTILIIATFGIVYNLILRLVQSVCAPESRQQRSTQVIGSVLGAVWFSTSDAWDLVISDIGLSGPWNLLGFASLLLIIVRHAVAKQRKFRSTVVTALAISTTTGWLVITLGLALVVSVQIVSRRVSGKTSAKIQNTLADVGLLSASVLIPLTSFLSVGNWRFLTGSTSSDLLIESLSNTSGSIGLSVLTITALGVLGVGVISLSPTPIRNQIGSALGMLYFCYLFFTLAAMYPGGNSHPAVARVASQMVLVTVLSTSCIQLLVLFEKKSDNLITSIVSHFLAVLMVAQTLTPLSQWTKYRTTSASRTEKSVAEANVLYSLNDRASSEDLPVLLLSYWSGDVNPLLNISTRLRVDFGLSDTFIHVVNSETVQHFETRSRRLIEAGVPNAIVRVRDLPKDQVICVTFEYSILNPLQPNYEIMKEKCRDVVEFSTIDLR